MSDRPLEGDHGSVRFAAVLEVDGTADVLQGHHMGDQSIDVDFTIHDPSAILGTSVRPGALPKAVPFQVRPVRQRERIPVQE